MQHYLLAVYQPAGGEPPPEVLEPVMRQIGELNEEIRAAGAWVMTGGLHAQESSTVVRQVDGETLVTDGPFAETKEFLGGLWVVATDGLDGAQEWARRISEITTLPVEVRPFQGHVLV